MLYQLSYAGNLIKLYNALADKQHMDLSIPLGGIQTADAAFDSAAQSITQAFNGGSPTQLGNAANQGDSVQLSTAVAGLLSSKLAFLANEKVALVESNLTKNTLSVLG